MATLDYDHYEIISDVRLFILGALPDALPTQVIRDTQNYASLPFGAITIAMLFDDNLDTSVTTYEKSLDQAHVQNSVEARMQISFYGDKADKRSRIIAQLWRNYYGADRLTKCQPLYVQSRQRLPYINDSNQYENRYILDLALQYNPVVTHAQDFTDSAEINIQPVITGG